MTPNSTPVTPGTLDGTGSSDHDQPYPLFGWRPRAAAPFPFSTRQFARLLILRSRFAAGLLAADDAVAALEAYGPTA